MEILLEGNTAREHALAWKFAESRRAAQLYCTSPYSGVDTLAKRIAVSSEAWLRQHPDALFLSGEEEWVGSPSAEALVVDCFTDGNTVLPIPAVLVHYDAAGFAVAAETTALPETIAGTYLQSLILGHTFQNPEQEAYRGILRLIFQNDGGAWIPAAVRHGFGELDALASLPLLRGELAGILNACRKQTLSESQVRFQPLFCAVQMIGAEREGEKIQNLPSVAPNIGIFFGAVQYRENALYTAGTRALFLCARSETPEKARTAVLQAANLISFHGMKR